MTLPARTLAALMALLAGGLLAVTLPAPSAAATPCGKKVLEDWFDNGRVDRLYPLHCYEEAIDAIPDDIRDYADAEEVISRALQAAVSGKLAPGGKDPTPGDGNGSDRPGPGGGTSSGGSDGGSGDDGTTGEATPEVDTSGPSTVPIPLLVLGGTSVALLVAGGLGYLARRRQLAEVEVEDVDDDIGG
jgi:hypothetical protein